MGRSKMQKKENMEASPKWVLERSYLEKYSTQDKNLNGF
jgi:hypothetical protein